MYLNFIHSFTHLCYCSWKPADSIVFKFSTSRGFWKFSRKDRGWEALTIPASESLCSRLQATSGQVASFLRSGFENRLQLSENCSVQIFVFYKWDCSVSCCSPPCWSFIGWMTHVHRDLHRWTQTTCLPQPGLYNHINSVGARCPGTQLYTGPPGCHNPVSALWSYPDGPLGACYACHWCWGFRSQSSPWAAKPRPTGRI